MYEAQLINLNNDFFQASLFRTIWQIYTVYITKYTNAKLPSLFFEIACSQQRVHVASIHSVAEVSVHSEEGQQNRVVVRQRHFR